MLFPTKSGQMDLRLWGYSYSQSEAGTTTTIEMVNEAAFEIKFPNAKESDGFFSGGATPSRPDAGT